MSQVYNLTKHELIACKICLKEVPRSEAWSDEVSDYIRYYFGLECYVVWNKKRNNSMTRR